MPAVAVQIGPPPTSTQVDLEPFDPASFTPEAIDDVDALVSSHKCSCAAGDDNPY